MERTVKRKKVKEPEQESPETQAVSLSLQLPPEFIKELKGSKEKNDKELAKTLDELRTKSTGLEASLHRSRMETQSALLQHRNAHSLALNSHKQNVDQIEKELKEAFGVLWPKLDEKLGKKELDELQSKLSEVSELIEKRHQSALKKLNQHKSDTTEESDKIKKSIKDLEKTYASIPKDIKDIQKLVKKAETYSYGSNLNILSNAVAIGFATSLNFKSGFTVALNPAGYIDITAASSGFTRLAPTQTPNGSRTVFTFATATAQPSYVVSDHALMPATDEDGVTVNWTWSQTNKQVTMTIPPNNGLFGVV